MSTPPLQAAVMQMMMSAWTAQTISAITRLDVPDILQANGPLTARQLTERHGVDAKPELLERALRACASVGVFTESADGRFGPTPLSEPLTLGSPVSVKRFVELIGGPWWTTFAGLPDVLRAGQPTPAPRSTEAPAPDPKHTQRFAEAMKSRVESTRGVLEHCDLSRARTLVDVGGSFGHLAIALLGRYPQLRASVLDLPEVIAIAEQHAATEDPSVRARLAFVAGDMFADVPEGDTYVLKTVIHDWDDASCVRVLGNCRARLPGDGRILCVDKVLPPMGDTSAAPAKLLDMLMLVSLPGKERTEAEWRALYAEAGLRVASITRIESRSGESIVEGVRA